MKIVNYISQLIIPVFILFVIIYGIFKKVKVYDSFISGAKDGVTVVVKIFPYLLAIFIAIKSFQASGAYDAVKNLFRGICSIIHLPVEVISISIIKPLSGSASLGVFTDIVKTTGPDSLASKISAVIMGSAETTFYVISVYIGAIGIKNTKYLVPVCIIADIVGIFIAILTVRLIF